MLKRVLIAVSLCALALCDTPVLAERAPDRVVTILQELIRADTSNPPGQEVRAVAVLERWLAQAPKLRLTRFEPAPGRVSLMARLPGSGKAPPLVLLGHLDVVPADTTQWTVPPFEGRIEEGYVWGRGAIDMKGMVAMQVEALLQLSERNEPLAGDVILLATADEEAGGQWGAEWLVENVPELSQAGWVLNEGSIGLRQDSHDIFPIQVAEKGVCWLKLTAKGQAGHGSMPSSDNAVLKISRAVELLGTHPFPLQGTEVTQTFLEQVSPLLPFPASFVSRHLFTPGLGALLRPLARPRLAEDPKIFAMLTNTVTPTRLEAGTKVNVIPNQATATIDARILPGETPEAFRDKLQSMVGPDVELEIIMASQPNQSPLNTRFYQIMAGVLKKHHPNAIVTPIMSAGATDSRFFRGQGIPAYGLIPILLPEADLSGLHGNDERIPLADLSTGVEIIKDIVSEVY